jgi:hypothetical protein
MKLHLSTENSVYQSFYNPSQSVAPHFRLEPSRDQRRSCQGRRSWANSWKHGSPNGSSLRRGGATRRRPIQQSAKPFQPTDTLLRRKHHGRIPYNCKEERQGMCGFAEYIPFPKFRKRLPTVLESLSCLCTLFVLMNRIGMSDSDLSLRSDVKRSTA